MQLLLDTHAALWWWTDDKLLSRRSYSAIEDDRNICHVSIATIWQCVIKCATKKMRLPAPACEFFVERMKDNAFSLLPLDLRHCVHWSRCRAARRAIRSTAAGGAGGIPID